GAGAFQKLPACPGLVAGAEAMHGSIHPHRALQVAQHGAITDPGIARIILLRWPEIAGIGRAIDGLKILELLAQSPCELRCERHLEVIVVRVDLESLLWHRPGRLISVESQLARVHLHEFLAPQTRHCDGIARARTLAPHSPASGGHEARELFAVPSRGDEPSEPAYHRDAPTCARRASGRI